MGTVDRHRPETKLVPCWIVGNRDASVAYHFMRDLAGRLAIRVQLTAVADHVWSLDEVVALLD